jgi:hypothetical protein
MRNLNYFFFLFEFDERYSAENEEGRGEREKTAHCARAGRGEKKKKKRLKRDGKIVCVLRVCEPTRPGEQVRINHARIGRVF